MKKKCIVISALGEESFTDLQIKNLQSALDVSFHSQVEEMHSDSFIDLCANAEIIGLTRRPLKKLDKDVIRHLPNLKAVAVYTTGYDWIDVDYLSQQQILLSFLPDYATITVAEHTLALILTMSRRVHLSSDKVKGRVAADVSLRGWELRNKSLGIIGFGRIGQEIASVVKSLGMNIAYFDDKQRPSDIDYLPFDELLKGSDIIVLSASRKRNATPLIGRQQFCLIKEGAYLINPSRSELVDNVELLKAIKSRRLAGYAVDDKIDLFLDDKELEEGRILQTGHTAWYSTEAIARGTENWVDNIIALGLNEPKNIIK